LLAETTVLTDAFDFQEAVVDVVSDLFEVREVVEVFADAEVERLLMVPSVRKPRPS